MIGRVANELRHHKFREDRMVYIGDKFIASFWLINQNDVYRLKSSHPLHWRIFQIVFGGFMFKQFSRIPQSRPVTYTINIFFGHFLEVYPVDRCIQLTRYLRHTVSIAVASTRDNSIVADFLFDQGKRCDWFLIRWLINTRCARVK